MSAKKVIEEWCFDFDGTITNIEPRYTAIYYELMLYFGGIPIKDYWSTRRRGLTEADVLRLSHLSPNIDMKYDAIREQKLESEKYLQLDQLFPYAITLLEYLIENGANICIVTHRSNEKLFLKQLKTLNLEKFVNGWVCTKDIKPSLDNKKTRPLAMTDDAISAAVSKSSFLSLRCNSSTQNLVMVGDSISDIKAAKLAKVKSIAVATGLYESNILTKLMPDIMVDSLESLLKLIYSGELYESI